MANRKYSNDAPLETWANSDTLTVLDVSDTTDGMGGTSKRTTYYQLKQMLRELYQAIDNTLTSIAELGTSADKMLYTTGLETWAEADLTAAGRALLDDADASAQRATLNVDASGTDNSIDVTLAGTPDYIKIIGQEITRYLINLTTHVTGVLPIANGGAPDL
ncbi:MAG: hypothetical protein DRP85_09365, partial [Candidatus Makaraimicrobium thalassicum]